MSSMVLVWRGGGNGKDKKNCGPAATHMDVGTKCFAKWIVIIMKITRRGIDVLLTEI